MTERNNILSLRGNLVEGRIEAGCDEAGRGCLAGPVVAAAVILPPGFEHPLLNDSKQISGKTRDLLRKVIEAEAVAWAVAMASPIEIDEINILNASFLAMNRAIKSLGQMPEHLLIDGNRFKSRNEIPFTCIVGGDASVRSIAAASVLAKTHRDELMLGLNDEYPAYGWNRNKGYPTRQHRSAIVQNGITPWHRKSFRLTENHLSLW
jgi:ribonuclease HII